MNDPDNLVNKIEATQSLVADLLGSSRVIAVATAKAGGVCGWAYDPTNRGWMPHLLSFPDTAQAVGYVAAWLIEDNDTREVLKAALAHAEARYAAAEKKKLRS